MKKMYKKPIVETEQVKLSSLVLAVSPGTITNGGTTGDSHIGSGDPLGD